MNSVPSWFVKQLLGCLRRKLSLFKHPPIKQGKERSGLRERQSRRCAHRDPSWPNLSQELSFETTSLLWRTNAKSISNAFGVPGRGLSSRTKSYRS